MDEQKFEELQDYLDEWGYDRDNDEVGEYLEKQGFHYGDEGIDDGDEDDGYIMYQSYRDDAHKYWVKIYYSTSDYLVSYIEYQTY